MEIRKLEVYIPDKEKGEVISISDIDDEKFFITENDHYLIYNEKADGWECIDLQEGSVDFYFGIHASLEDAIKALIRDDYMVYQYDSYRDYIKDKYQSFKMTSH